MRMQQFFDHYLKGGPTQHGYALYMDWERKRTSPTQSKAPIANSKAMVAPRDSEGPPF